jgi:chitin deacetylase
VYSSPHPRVVLSSKLIFYTHLKDWELTYGAIPLSTVEASLASFYKLSKSPGLIILEHELSDDSVTAFISSWGIMHSENWTPVSIPDAANLTTDPQYAWYQNGLNDTAAIVSMSFGTGPQGTPGGSTTTTTGSSTSSPLNKLGLTTTDTTTGSGTPTASATHSTKTGGAVLVPRAPGVVLHSSTLLIGVASFFTYLV